MRFFFLIIIIIIGKLTYSNTEWFTQYSSGLFNTYSRRFNFSKVKNVTKYIDWFSFIFLPILTFEWDYKFWRRIIIIRWIHFFSDLNYCLFVVCILFSLVVAIEKLNGWFCLNFLLLFYPYVLDNSNMNIFHLKFTLITILFYNF